MAGLARHQRDAGVVVDLRHPVVHPGHDGLAEAPTEHAAVEALRPVDIGGRKLDVNDFACHASSSSVMCWNGTTWVRPGRRAYSLCSGIPTAVTAS